MSEAPTTVSAGRLSPEAAGRLVGELYDRHGRAVLGICRLMLRDPVEAEDATQSAFLAAHGALLRGSVPRDGGAWITQIARNECRARIRERMQSPLTADEEAVLAIAAVGADPAEIRHDESVQRALATLPDRQRDAVVLHDVFGLRSREVATALGVSLTAVEALIFRARRQLRVRLEPVAGALAVPVGIRDTLASAIPGFADGSAAAGVAAGGGLGAALLAKLASAPVAAKVTAAAVAATATGSLVAVEATREKPPAPPRIATTTASGAAPSGGGTSESSGRTGRAAVSDASTIGSSASSRGSADAGGDDRQGDGRYGRDGHLPASGDASASRTGRSGPSDDAESRPGAPLSATSGSGDSSRHDDDERSGPSSDDEERTVSSEPAKDDDGDRSGPSGRVDERSGSSELGSDGSADPREDERSGSSEHEDDVSESSGSGTSGPEGLVLHDEASSSGSDSSGSSGDDPDDD